MVSARDIIPEIVAGFIAILIIVFDAIIVAYQMANGQPINIPELFQNVTFAVVAVYFTQQAQTRAAQRISAAIAQQSEIANGTPHDPKSQPPA